MKKRLKKILGLFKDAYKEYSQDDTWVLGAALSYYTIFSIAPVLIIVIAIAGMIFGHDAVSGEVYRQLRSVLGSESAAEIQAMVKSAYSPKESIIATIIAIVLLVFGATTVFYQLQSSLNKIWEVKPNPKKGFMMYIRTRFLSFSLIIAIGFLLLVSLVVNAGMVALTSYLMSFLPDYSVYLFRALDLVLSVGIITILFAMIYRFLPDAIVRWRDVWIGACFTAVLFTIGRFAIGWYLGTSNIGSTYGAAGSVVVLLVWVSYSSQILFFGAEFTQVYAQSSGTPIRPAPYAKRIKMVPVEQNENENSYEFEEKVHSVEEMCDTEEDIDPKDLKFKKSKIRPPHVRPDGPNPAHKKEPGNTRKDASRPDQNDKQYTPRPPRNYPDNKPPHRKREKED